MIINELYLDLTKKPQCYNGNKGIELPAILVIAKNITSIFSTHYIYFKKLKCTTKDITKD